MARALGRNRPPNFDHVAAAPASRIDLIKPGPVVFGTDWYTQMDNPVQGTDGKYRIVKAASGGWGTVRGGHCYCAEPVGAPDAERNWVWHDQKEAPACEGFGHSRAVTLLTGQKNAPGTLFDAFWLYNDARRCEGTYPKGEGSTNLFATAALKKYGDHRAAGVWVPLPAVIPGEAAIEHEITKHNPVSVVGVSWYLNFETIRIKLGYGAGTEEIPILNSWGKNDYPHRVYLPAELIELLLKQEGEADSFEVA